MPELKKYSRQIIGLKIRSIPDMVYRIFASCLEYRYTLVTVAKRRVGTENEVFIKKMKKQPIN